MVISSDIISNEPVGNSENILYMHRIHNIQVQLITYHIKVAKFQRIWLNAKQDNFTGIKFFDGPSVKCRVIPITLYKLYGTSFQIIAQVCKKVILQYKGVNLTQIHKKFVKGNFFNFEIPGYVCDDIKMCGLQFENITRNAYQSHCCGFCIQRS